MLQEHYRNIKGAINKEKDILRTLWLDVKLSLSSNCLWMHWLNHNITMKTEVIKVLWWCYRFVYINVVCKQRKGPIFSAIITWVLVKLLIFIYLMTCVIISVEYHADWACRLKYAVWWQEKYRSTVGVVSAAETECCCGSWYIQG